jgi:hypothetical protein
MPQMFAIETEIKKITQSPDLRMKPCLKLLYIKIKTIKRINCACTIALWQF